MQAIDLFSTMVAAVGVVHLVVSLGGRVSAARGNSRSREPKNPAARSDWYVFFSCSSLYGTPKKVAASRREGRTSGTPRTGLQRSRPRAILSR